MRRPAARRSSPRARACARRTSRSWRGSTTRSFRALFTKSPVKRTGRDRFIRNVLIAIGNAGDAALAADAERLLDDASPLVRGAAVWALSRLDPARLATHAGTARSRSRSGRARGMDRRARKRDGLMATLLCLGLGYCARYYVAEFGARFDRIIGTSRTPKPAGQVEMLAFDAASPSDEVRSGRRGGDASPDLGHARRSRRSDRRRARERDRGRADARGDRLSLVAGRLWRSQRRVGRRDRDDDSRARARRRAAPRRAGVAGAGTQARRAGRGAAARRHLRPRAERVHAAAHRTRAPRRQAGTRVQPHPRRRHRAGDRRRVRDARPTASSTSPTTSPRPIPTRC